MTGGAFGSLFAQLFHLSAAERKTLLVAGAAGGHGGGVRHARSPPCCSRWNCCCLNGSRAASSRWRWRRWSASVLRVPLLGRGPDLSGGAACGLLGAGDLAIALAVGRARRPGLGAAHDARLLLRRFVSANCRSTGCGGRRSARLVVGIGGMIDPRVLGVGYDTIHQLMRGEILGRALVGLLMAKAHRLGRRAGFRHVRRRARAVAHDGRRARRVVRRMAVRSATRACGRWSAWRR